MKKQIFSFLFLCICLFTQAQNATFITIDDANNLSKVTVNATGTCSSTSLNLCNNISGNILSIALNGNLLYLVNNAGDLYSTTLNTSTNCKKLGTFLSGSSQIFGLTVDKNGKVYAANGNQIETYDPSKPAASRFKIVGNVATAYQVGGDLLFYLGQLYMSCKNNVLLAIDTLNPANSTPYLTFSSPKVFGFASVSVPCSNNAAYALSTSGNSTNIIGINMATKTETGTICNLNYQIYDAASVAESGVYTPPTPPSTSSPLNYCQNATATALTANAAGTLYWYNTAKGGTGNTTAPTPNTATVNTTTFYVSQKDATGCESERDSIKVVINATNPNPTINITANKTNLCAGSTTTFTATITGGGTTPTYQWYKNGIAISGTNNNTYTPTILNNNDTIRCSVTTNATCVATPTSKSNNILITTISPTVVALIFDSCKQVTYFGKIYTTNTTINDTVKSLQGCDSIFYNVAIMVKQPTTSTTTINTTTPYNWNGTTYTTSGTYTKAGFVNSIGCDSTATLILIITQANPCWKSISAGYGWTVAIKANGTLWAWGRNEYGQLGDGTNITKLIPTKIGIANNWESISSGASQTVAIKTDGTLWAWGQNLLGELGDGTTIDKNTPIQIGNSNKWAHIGAGGFFTIGIKTDGTLWSWGDNYSGELGDGTNTNKIIPKQVGAANNWASISTGYNHAVAIKLDGTLWAWGENIYGQLGDGTNISKNSPIQIGTANNWASVSAGYRYTVAIKTDGTLWAWGDNYWWELGDGTNINKNLPTQIGIANNWASASACLFHTVAIKVDGTLWAWGRNEFGQLGDGTIIVRNVPTLIGTANNWATIGGNGESHHTVAIKTDGTLWTWGHNGDGAIGNGTFTYNQTIPLLIINGCTPCPTPTTKTINLSDCKLVIYKGISYKVNAIVKDTIKTVAGCDSIYNIATITITPLIVTTNTQTLTSCKTIIYNGIPYSSSTVVKDTIRTLGGCDSIYSITNIIISAHIATAKTINLFDCKTVTYNSIPYTSSTTLYDTIKSLVGCGDSIYYTINITIAAPATTIAVPLFDCNSVNYKSKIYTTSTSFIDTLKSKQGCDSIYNNVAISIAPATKAIPIALFDCKSVVYKTKSYTTSTSFTDTIKSYLGCDSIYNNVAITIATPATTIAVPLFGCKSVTYKTKTFISSVLFIDTVKGYLGCDSIYNNVTINIAPAAVSLPVNLKDCKSITYKGKTYTASTPLFIDTLKSKQGCDSIYNNVNIVITTLNPTTTKLQYAACDYVNYSGNTYYSSTQILDTFRTATGCDSAYQTVNITVYPMPTIIAGSDLFVFLNKSVVLNPVINNATKIEWTPKLYLNNYNTDLVTCTPLKDIIYKIKTTSKDGCVDSAFQKIIVDKALNIPNVFTPNGDKTNDTWAIDGLRIYPRSIVQVFNRYGQNVFTSSPGNYKPWDGKLNGNDLPVGTYYYILKLTADATPISGSITILR